MAYTKLSDEYNIQIIISFQFYMYITNVANI